MLGILLIGLLGIASLQVWTVVILRWRAGQPILSAAPRLSSPHLAIAWPAAAIYVGSLLILQLVAAFQPSETSPTVTIHGVQAICIDGAFVTVIAFMLLSGLGRTPARDYGFDPRNLGQQLTEGGLAFLASFAPVFIVLLTTSWLRTDDNQHPLLKLLIDDPTGGTFAWIVVTAVIIAPIKEELLFRVMLQDGLARRIGAAPAIGIVAVLFCAVHGFPDSLALLPLAVILGYLYHQRQSAIAVMTTHALFNLTNLVILLLGGLE